MSRHKQRSYTPERAPRVDIRIDDLDDTGRGVGRIDGKVVFVDGALPGETVRARYQRTGRRADEAVAEAVLTASADRVEALCPVFGRCGGCTLQHWSVDAQRRHRAQRVYEQLTRATGQWPQRWLAPVLGPSWSYRGRARWRCRWLAEHGVVLGFRERGGHYAVDIDACPILDDRLSALLPGLKRLIGGLERPGHIAEVEACASDADTAVGLVCRNSPTSVDEARLARYQEETGVAVAYRQASESAFTPVDTDRSPRLCYRLPGDGLTLWFALGDFVQANRSVNAALVERAMTLLSPGPGQRVLDLFSGIGNFGLPAANRGAEVVGLEGDAGLVERANANAVANGVSERASFEQADLAASDQLDRLSGWSPDAVVLDPPRAGAAEAVAALVSRPPQRVVYVACEPSTMARDLARLTQEGGYRLSAAGFADMFPHTDHTEAIACLQRR